MVTTGGFAALRFLLLEVVAHDRPATTTPRIIDEESLSACVDAVLAFADEPPSEEGQVSVANIIGHL